MPRPERREASRRSGLDRRETDRRLVIDRRYSSERRGRLRLLVAHESPAEHVRNAMQLLMTALETHPTLTAADFTHVAESALARLSLAIAGLEKPR